MVVSMSTIKELGKALADLSARLDVKHEELKKELSDVFVSELKAVKQSMDFINEKFEEFKTNMVEVNKELTTLKTDTHELKSANDRLFSELKAVRQEVVDLQQYSRRSNVEIKGVPMVEGEDLIATVKTISVCVNAEIEETDIEIVHRVPTKNAEQQNIIAKFASRASRDKLLTAAKKQRLNVSALGFEGNDPIYINDHLCPANKILLGKALKAKKEKNWKFTWVRDGKILMRKAEKSRVLHIKSAEDLAQVV